MPRTKTARKVFQKRNDELEMRTREFDTMVERYMVELEEDYNDQIVMIEKSFKQLKAKLSKQILNCRLKDLKEMEITSIFDATMATGTMSDISTIAPLSLIEEKLRYRENQGNKKSHVDDGYSTEDGTQSNRSSGVGSYKSSQSGCSTTSRLMGPLASSKSRRSRSAGPSATPLKQTGLLSSTKSMKTVGGLSTHASRTKYKTPLANRSKAISADRLMITPKVQPGSSVALLRRANVGEIAYSISGSPVLTAAAGFEDVANVNIPVAAGILSLRPTQMNVIESQVVHNFDSDTIEQLRALQHNLNKLMHAAEKRNYNLKKK